MSSALPKPSPAILALEAEIAGDERAIRHLIGEQKAITSKLHRQRAHEQLLEHQLHAITTRGHPLAHGARFPDVSSYQPNVDWGAVHAAKSVRVGGFAMCKLTEGGGWTDALGAIRLGLMAKQGMRRGAYHFGHPSVSPIEQAQHYLNAGAHLLGADDIACGDWEVSDGEPGNVVRSCVAAFAAEVAKHTPAKRWLYTGGPFAREFGLTLSGYDAHWLAAYVGDPAPYMVFGPQRTVAWQYTDGKWGPAPRVCPGVGPCDMSIVL